MQCIWQGPWQAKLPSAHINVPTLLPIHNWLQPQLALLLAVRRVLCCLAAVLAAERGAWHTSEPSAAQQPAAPSSTNSAHSPFNAARLDTHPLQACCKQAQTDRQLHHVVGSPGRGGLAAALQRPDSCSAPAGARRNSAVPWPVLCAHLASLGVT